MSINTAEVFKTYTPYCPRSVRHCMIFAGTPMTSMFAAELPVPMIVVSDTVAEAPPAIRTDPVSLQFSMTRSLTLAA